MQLFKSYPGKKKDYTLDLKNMVGLVTDGAAVMLGILATPLKQIIPHLITVHCMAQ